MSVEAARVFVNRMFTDKAFLDKISSIADLEERQSAVKAAGYDFSREDADKLVPPGWTLEQLSALKPDSEELPDALLEAIAGGKGTLGNEYPMPEDPPPPEYGGGDYLMPEESSSQSQQGWNEMDKTIYWLVAIQVSIGASAAAAS